MKKVFSVLLLAFIIVSCSSITGEEIARLSLDKVSTKNNIFEKEISLALEKDDEISFWTKMDFKYENDVEIRYRIRVYKNDEEFKVLEYDPREKNITFGEVKTSFNDKTNWSFTGKNGELKIDETAQYTFKAILKTSTNKSFVFKVADLILKK
tara:strand:+ start:22 stop:480 length:459 start_codon:yes stop_codon:yes gene_type:complete